MLLTIANLDRMGPPRPKNPHRISIWAYEVSIACSQCSKPEPVVQSPKFWKRIFSRDSSFSSSTASSTAVKSKSGSPLKIPKLRSKASTMSIGKRRQSSTPTAVTETPSAMETSPQHIQAHHLAMHLPLGLAGHNDEMSRTAMYAPGLESEWAVDDWGEDDNGESSLDMASSESGAGWGARDRAQRLDRAERLLNTNDKKTKMAAMRQGRRCRCRCVEADVMSTISSVAWELTAFRAWS